MSLPDFATPTGSADGWGLLQKLFAAVRPEFRGDELVFGPRDPVFGGPPCRMPDFVRTGRGRGLCSFTHVCGKTRNGRFWLRRITISKRMRAKLSEVKDQLKRRRHQPIPVQGRWLASVVRGHLACYAVPGNTEAVRAFRKQVTRHWFKALRRRSQRKRVNWARMDRIVDRWLPRARVMHPFPATRLAART